MSRLQVPLGIKLPPGFETEYLEDGSLVLWQPNGNRYRLILVEMEDMEAGPPLRSVMPACPSSKESSSTRQIT